MKALRTAKYFWLKLIRLKGDPQTLARGVAIGLFIGITPTLPLHTILILFFAATLRGNTIVALLTATAVSNPFTFFFQYYFSWRIGNWLFPGQLNWTKIKEVVDILLAGGGLQESFAAISRLSYDAIIVMLTGGFLLALPLTILGYIVSLKFFAVIQNRRRQKHILK